jgi:hypothetical protein
MYFTMVVRYIDHFSRNCFETVEVNTLYIFSIYLSMQELTSSNFQDTFFMVLHTSEALMAFATYFRHLICFILISYAT